MKRKPTLLEAFIPIIMMLFLLAIGYGVYGFSPEPLLILASIFAGFIALRVGVGWDEMMLGIREKLDMAMPAILVLISIGILIGTWMISGTIPMMIYYGLELINPRFIVLIAFVVTAIISIVTGTSWGSAGTVGVALMGIAIGLGASLPATAGAIVAGSYFGDKLSPLSDTTNLAPIAAGSELYEHIKHMLYTTIPAAVISMIVYTFVGFNLSDNGVSTPEETSAMLQTLGEMFDWNLLLLLPPIVVLYGSITKKPTLPTIIFSSILAGIIANLYQGFSLTDIFASVVTGFDVSMVNKPGFDSEGVIFEVTRLVNQGGMQSMTSVILIAFSAFAFAGIITKAGALDVIMDALLKVVKKTGDLILSTVASCITMALVTGNSYLSIIVPGELFKETYKKKNLQAKNLSRTLEDSGTVVVPLIPWSSAGVYMAGVLGVPTLSYAPWAILCYTGFIIAIILGYTGIGIKKISEESRKEKAS
ncbi:Na+/H+ antiporter NhaC [Virgibacillus phasianinus]|uniref:Na+/H+ antiporter NhaC n=1 Tax=Virgibacillus phasianinus TaxID=2017483 RepID=A0A220U2D5_9BACI|nr:Na+/H+ antiporter NhaC [Virgibacillus phasianinus]ASK62434.1 Na+/H+ antiporter NhaC [Virgibacillus phasianinus]